MKHQLILLLLGLICLTSCDPDKDIFKEEIVVDPVLEQPEGFPPLPNFAQNPITEKGIEIGKDLFESKLFSRNNAVSCASCHSQSTSFSDSVAFSQGLYGGLTSRNSMPLVNLIYHQVFFWDGRVVGLENQIFHPVRNGLEMDMTWPEVLDRLSQDTLGTNIRNYYETQFIDSNQVSQLMAQYIRSLISANSRFDKMRRGEIQFTLQEARGMFLFQNEGPMPGEEVGNGADCFHCHTLETGLFTDLQFHNNGLDSEFTDLGHNEVTGNPRDIGTFKTPTLRNIEHSAPYMHDGRFSSLEEVIEHYNSGVVQSPSLDPKMKFSEGLKLSQEDKDALLAFLLTLSDEDFLSNTNQ